MIHVMYCFNSLKIGFCDFRLGPCFPCEAGISNWALVIHTQKSIYTAISTRVGNGCVLFQLFFVSLNMQSQLLIIISTISVRLLCPIALTAFRSQFAPLCCNHRNYLDNLRVSFLVLSAMFG